MTKLDGGANYAHAFELDSHRALHDDGLGDATVEGRTLAWLVIL
jgi:hypothetical protein